MTRHGQAAIVLLFMTVCLIGRWAAAQSEGGNPVNGKRVYEQQCLRCHGERLDGQGPEGRYLIIPPADFQSLKSRSKDDWELLVAIYHGVLFTPMHAFRDKLPYDDIRDVLSYIRQMAPYGNVG